jgi:hypothetical protein
MTMLSKILLTADCVINLVLGALLLLFPAGMIDILGMPPADHHFYTTILGGVIVGIGIALLIELRTERSGVRGLGLAGAIAINLFGGGVLLVWLVASPFDLPMRGHLVLWTVGMLVVGIGVVELVTGSWKKE